MFALTCLHASAAIDGPPVDVDPALLSKLATSLGEETGDRDRFDAEVWLKSTDAKLERFVDDRTERLNILHAVYRESHRHELDADLVLAVMHVESAFNRFAISRVGAQGLMQIMPFWRVELGRDQDNLTDIETNVRYGTTILNHYLEVSKGDLVEALGRYNGSRGRLKYPELVVKKWRQTWQTQSELALPALRETCLNYRLRACWDY